MKRTYRARIFVWVYVTVVFTIILLTTLIFLWLRVQTVKDVERAQMDTLHNVNSVFSSTLNGFLRSGREIYTDGNTMALLSQGEYWNDPASGPGWVSPALRYSIRVNSAISNDSAIKVVALFDQNDYIMMSQRQAISEESRQGLHNILTSQQASILMLKADDMVYKRPMAVFCVVTGQKDFSSARWKNGVVIGLDAAAVSQSIFGDNGSSAYYIIDEQDTVLLSSDAAALGMRLFDAPENETALYPPGGAGYSVHMVENPEKGYRVVSVLPSDQALHNLQSGLLQLVLTGGGILLLSLLATIFISRQLARPVTELMHDIVHIAPAQKAVAFPDDMAFARAALKRMAGMLGELGAQNLTQQRIHLLMGTGGLPERELFPPEQNWWLAVLQLGGSLNKAAGIAVPGAEPDAAFIAGTVSSMLEEMGCMAGFLCFPLQGEKVALALPDQNGRNLELLEQLQGAIGGLLGREATLAVSTPREALAAGKNAEPIALRFYSVIALLSHRALRGDNAVLLQEAEEGLPPAAVPGHIRKRIMDAVRQGDLEQAAAVVGELLALAAAWEYGSALEQLALLCREASALIGQALTTPDQESFEHIYRALAQCGSSEGLAAELTGRFTTAAQLVKTAHATGSKELVERAEALIAAQYADPDLSLKRIAAQLNLSASYFSRIFRDHAGSTFPAYVNTLRLNRACDLLHGSGLTVSQIAAAVGFYSGSYFASAFRKQYGIPPSKARAGPMVNGAPQAGLGQAFPVEKPPDTVKQTSFEKE